MNSEFVSQQTLRLGRYSWQLPIRTTRNELRVVYRRALSREPTSEETAGDARFLAEDTANATHRRKLGDGPGRVFAGR